MLVRWFTIVLAHTIYTADESRLSCNVAIASSAPLALAIATGFLIAA
jgi:hypothetical protein